jgi:hypothetical protein
MEEDGLLRQLLAAYPKPFRELKASDGSLSFKDTLGHIAFWDDFTVNFFLCKIDPGAHRVAPPENFDESSRDAIVTMRKLPFGEVLARYLEAHGALLDFLGTHWQSMSEKERNDFWIPLKHRRQHRLLLEEELKKIGQVDDRENPREMSAPA